MNDCTLCKIINGGVPSYKVYEDEKAYMFLDIIQMIRGHTLMISKQYVVDILEYNDVLANDVFTRTPKVVRALEKAFPEMEGLNILNNNKEVTYQSVFYSHVHLIPCYSEEDDFSIHFGNHQEDYSAEAMQEIVETIVKQVNQMKKFIRGLFFGAAADIIGGLLTAPRDGKKTRQHLISEPEDYRSLKN